MTPEQRHDLTRALARLSARMAADVRDQLLADGPARRRALELHADEHVGDDFDVWTDLLSRRAAVIWVLKSVYVRVLEDRGLLEMNRIVDRESQELFERLAPNLGETAYLEWVYRDLAQTRGGLPDLFARQPAEITRPDHVLSRELLELWRGRDPDTGEMRWRFDQEHFDGQLMGDLYQDLDPVVKDRYALLQTPDFVRDFILDQTLTPAIEEWGAENVRVLDPSCGSGHFLLEAFRRLVAATMEKRPDCSPPAIVRDALERVVGIDLNDYACALARARLVMLAMELAGQNYLKAANFYHPQVYWADGLEQVEDDQRTIHGAVFEDEAERRAVMTRPEVREVLGAVLRPGFHVVVGNPPYITEKDKVKKAYHREKVGKQRRYKSAYREYSLASPFTERCFQLACAEGYVGLIVSNNFMKREFGKALVKDVLAQQDLFKVVDCAGAYIPGHGTPTVLLFGRRRPARPTPVTAVMGKRGEPAIPSDPVCGKVWSSIALGHSSIGHETEFTSTAELDRSLLSKHPWSLGGGGATALCVKLEEFSDYRTLDQQITSIGFGAISGEDNVFVQDKRFLERRGLEYWPLIIGENIKDWGFTENRQMVWPYDAGCQERPETEIATIIEFFWPYRSVLKYRKVFGRPLTERGIPWWAVREVYTERLMAPHLIAFAFVATHNRFTLAGAKRVYKQSAPIFKIGAGATEADYLCLLGLLNSSTACFWMKQVFHCKGAQGVNEGIKAEQWMQFYEFDATKIKAFPVPDSTDQTPYASKLHETAQARVADSIPSVLDADDWQDAKTLGHLLEARRERDTTRLLQMVGLQEELDWLCYRLYGLDDAIEVLAADEVPSLRPGLRPFEITLARADAERRALLERGETPSESPTAWFERHRWEPRLDVPAEVPVHYRKLMEDRLERTRKSKNLSLIEQPTYKRRWYNPDYEKEEREALREWLADRLEDVVEHDGRLRTPRQLAALLEGADRVRAAASLYLGRTVHDLEALVVQLLDVDSVPSHPSHRYSKTGLPKRAAWEHTWAEQRREDAGEDVTPPVPPKYVQKDFLKPSYFRLRGKLDVPRERFIALTEIPETSSGETLYGWAGWTPYDRARKLLEHDAELERDGVPVSERLGLLDTAWRLLADVEREHPVDAKDFRTEIELLVGGDGPSAEAMSEWRDRVPPPRKRGKRR